MGKIAVDAVLLPCEAMMDIAVETNRRLTGRSRARIVLDKTNCLPHISLAMGCIAEDDIVPVGKVLKEIAGRYSPLRLKVSRIGVSTNSVGEKVSVFEIERTESLQSLHEEVMRESGPYFSCEVRPEMVLGPAVSASTLLWIKHYRKKSSFANFSGHITVGYGEIGGSWSEMGFTASRLALCRLGDHCTCRKVLAASALGRRA